MWVELHHILVLDMISLVDEFADHIVIMVGIDDPEQLYLFVPDCDRVKLALNGIRVGDLGYERVVVKVGK